MIELLKTIGLTDGEAKVYLALHELKESTVGPISKKSNVSYSKVHIILDKLIKKGLCSHILIKKVTHYKAAHPSRIIEYLNNKQVEIEKQKKDSQKLIERLIQNVNESADNEKLELFEGYEGLKTVYLEGLAKMKANDYIYVLGGSLGIYTNEKSYKTFFEQINRIRQEKKIKYKIIFNKNLKKNTNVTNWSTLKNTEVRYLLENTPASVNIHANRVLIIYWTESIPKTFLIESSIVANSFRMYFEAIWSIAKK
jgi:sugar-specific transcriptional regulator TrmB